MMSVGFRFFVVFQFCCFVQFCFLALLAANANVNALYHWFS